MFCREELAPLAFPGKMLSGYLKCPTQGGKVFRSTGCYAPKLTDFCSESVAFFLVRIRLITGTGTSTRPLHIWVSWGRGCACGKAGEERGRNL